MGLPARPPLGAAPRRSPAAGRPAPRLDGRGGSAACPRAAASSRAAGATARLRGQRSRPADSGLHTQPAAKSSRSPRVREEEEGLREAGGELPSRGTPPPAMLSGPDLGPAPTAFGRGRCEGAQSSRRPFYSPRRGSAGTEQPVPLSGGLPACPRRRSRRLPAPPSPRPTGGPGLPGPAHRPPSVPPLCRLREESRFGPRPGGEIGMGERPPAARRGWGDAGCPRNPPGVATQRFPGSFSFFLLYSLNFSVLRPEEPHGIPEVQEGGEGRGGLGAVPASPGSRRRWLCSCRKVSHATGDASQHCAGSGRFRAQRNARSSPPVHFPETPLQIF